MLWNRMAFIISLYFFIPYFLLIMIYAFYIFVYFSFNIHNAKIWFDCFHGFYQISQRIAVTANYNCNFFLHPLSNMWFHLVSYEISAWFTLLFIYQLKKMVYSILKATSPFMPSIASPGSIGFVTHFCKNPCFP